MTPDSANRLNWRDATLLRKQGVDAYLDQYRQGVKPRINVDAVVFIVMLLAVLAVGFYLLGLDDGMQMCQPFTLKGGALMRLRRPLPVTIGQIVNVLVALVIFAIATLGMYARLQ